MNKYFRLNTYCYLENGINGGCIYNLITGEMIAINSDICNLLNRCEENQPINNLDEKERTLLHEMFIKQLGMFYESPVYVDKFYLGSHPQMDAIVPPNYTVGNVFLELSTDCNFNCVFCDKGDDTLFRMTGCKRWSTDKNKVIQENEVWIDIIEQVSKIGCKQLTFIGGEPFIKFEQLKKLIPYSKRVGIEKIVVFTNGYFISDEILRLIKKYNVELNILILGHSSHTNARVTGVQDAARCISDNICLLSSIGVDFTLTYLIGRFNENEIEDTKNHYGNIIDASKMRMNFLYPLPPNEFYSKKFMAAFYDKRRSMQKINAMSFCNSKKYHNCYGGQLAITAVGDVMPCIMSRTMVLGNIKKASIVSILAQSKYDYYQRLTKDNVDGCKECSYRYGCFDCRALEIAATGSITGLEYCSMLKKCETALNPEISKSLQQEHA